MSVFRFRLETPLRLARARRGELRRELAAALRALVDVEAELALLCVRRDEIDVETSRRVTEGIGGGELSRLAEARAAADGAFPPLHSRRERLDREESEARKKLGALTREIQVLEKLREEARLEWHRDRIKKEQSEADELTLVRRASAQLAARERGVKRDHQV